MREKQIIEYRGFGLGQLLVAALTGAAAGATVAYLTTPARGEDNRRRLRALMDNGKDDIAHLPLALKRATEAARDAFNEALDQQNRHG